MNYIIKGFMSAGFEVAWSDNTLYLVKAGYAALRVVCNERGLACVMQGKDCLWQDPSGGIE